MPTAFTIASSRPSNSSSGNSMGRGGGSSIKDATPPSRPPPITCSLSAPTTPTSSSPESLSSSPSTPPSPSAKRRGFSFRRSLSRRPLLTCDECKYVAEDEARYNAHFKEPRHVNHYRNMAYKEPKKRQMWLKIWFNTLEKAEVENGEAFEVDETAEDELAAAEAAAAAAAASKKGRRRSSFFGLLKL